MDETGKRIVSGSGHIFTVPKLRVPLYVASEFTYLAQNTAEGCKQIGRDIEILSQNLLDKNLRQDNCCFGRDSNPPPPKYNFKKSYRCVNLLFKLSEREAG